MRIPRFPWLFTGLLALACGNGDGPGTAESPPAPAPVAPDAARPPYSVPLSGTFAFASAAGDALLSLSMSEDPQTYTWAVCADVALPVQYARTQLRSPESSHRQVASDFAHEPGDVYEVLGGTVRGDATCFVTTNGILPHLVAAEAVSGNAQCGEVQVALLERIAGRSAQRCSRLARLEGDVDFVAVQYVRVDTLALAALALIDDDDVFLYRPFPAAYTGSGGSVWRVDDGGVFDPRAIRLLFAARLPDGWAVAYAWAGAEGESLELVAADSMTEARTIVQAYRYRAP